MVERPWYKESVKTMAISRFKAQCLSVLEAVRRTGEPILVTRFGKPVAEIIPPPASSQKKGWLGRFADQGRILGDVVSPAADAGDWEALEE